MMVALGAIRTKTNKKKTSVPQMIRTSTSFSFLFVWAKQLKHVIETGKEYITKTNAY